MKWAGQRMVGHISYFLSPDRTRIVGIAAQAACDKPGWVHYMNQVENPPLPVTLGTAPVVSPSK